LDLTNIYCYTVLLSRSVKCCDVIIYCNVIGLYHTVQWDKARTLNSPHSFHR